MRIAELLPEPAAPFDPELFIGVDGAAAAPSVLHSHPWSFLVHNNCLEIHADRDRWLRHRDPLGRSLTLSCGAAVLYAELAFQASGRQCRTNHLPEPGDPDLIARLTLGAAQSTPPAVARLASAMSKHGPHAKAFGAQPVTAGDLAALADASAREGASLHVITADQLTEVAVLYTYANTTLENNDGYVAERHRLAVALGDDASPATTSVRRATIVPLPGTACRPSRVLDGPPEAEHPTLVALSTVDDDQLAWVQAGRAMARLLLEATCRGLAASQLPQALHVPGVRLRLGLALSMTGHPQVVLRLGHLGNVDVPDTQHSST